MSAFYITEHQRDTLDHIIERAIGNTPIGCAPEEFAVNAARAYKAALFDFYEVNEQDPYTEISSSSYKFASGGVG